MNERTFDNDSIDDQPLPWGNYLAGAKVLIFFAPLYWKLEKSQEIYLPMYQAHPIRVVHHRFCKFVEPVG